MIREEAITKIKRKACFGGHNNKHLCQWADEGFGKCEECENYMAIKALEQELCDDAISRKAAIDKMQDLEDEDIKTYGCSIPEGFDGKRAIEALKALSSIQPKTEWIPVSERLPETDDEIIKALEQESYTDAISRQAVLATLDNMDNVLDEDRTIENYKELLKECYEVLSPVTPQPKTGHWTDSSNGWMCSECKRDSRKDTDYCPNCGAKMQEVEV